MMIQILKTIHVVNQTCLMLWKTPCRMCSGSSNSAFQAQLRVCLWCWQIFMEPIWATHSFMTSWNVLDVCNMTLDKCLVVIRAQIWICSSVFQLYTIAWWNLCRTRTLFAGGRKNDLGIFGAWHEIVGQINNQNSYLKVQRDCLFSSVFLHFHWQPQAFSILPYENVHGCSQASKDRYGRKNCGKAARMTFWVI